MGLLVAFYHHVQVVGLGLVETVVCIKILIIA